jgi:RNA polymerase sigma factor (sigma-70 family)
MSRLNECASQGVAAAADNAKMPVDTLADSKVVSNFRIACQLSEEKTKLVEALSQFPVAALWLFDRYEEPKGNKEAEQEEEAGVLSESTAILQEIKKYYFLASRSFSLSRPGFLNDKQRLMEALQLFPFSFHDLTRLIDVIVYAYKFRGLYYKPSGCVSNTNSHLISKRLEGLKRRDNLNSSTFLDSIRASAGRDLNERFLLLDGSEMQKIFTEMVLTEHRWLNARERLATANSRLVMFIANQYKGGFLDFDDLVQEGQTGLLKAVDRYDYRLGYKFSTYAGYWIRQAISRALSRCERVVRIPCGQMGVINKVFRIREQLFLKLGKEPSVNELSDCTGLSIDEINTILSISQSAISLEDSSEEDESAFSPIDFLEQQLFTHPFGDIAQSELESLISKAIKLLSPREAKVVCGHFGVQFDHEMTLKEIGHELNLTRERVRQIQVAALNKMKQFYGQQLATCL